MEIKHEKRLLCRAVPHALSCLENIPCKDSDAAYSAWIWAIGTVKRNNYLCSDDAENGE